MAQLLHTQQPPAPLVAPGMQLQPAARSTSRRSKWDTPSTAAAVIEVQASRPADVPPSTAYQDAINQQEGLAIEILANDRGEALPRVHQDAATKPAGSSSMDISSATPSNSQSASQKQSNSRSRSPTPRCVLCTLRQTLTAGYGCVCLFVMLGKRCT